MSATDPTEAEVLAAALTGNYSTVAPAGQASTNATVVLAGCGFDARPWTSIAYTIAVATQAVTWSVFGANAADYSDEQIVQAAASVAAAGTGTYVAALAPYAYYRVKIIDTVGGTHGTATVRGIVKA
jgi:hypothetical protein